MNRMHVVLHEPEIPQNTGNIGRTCVAVGAHLWIVRPAGFRLDARQLRRAGLDYWEHLQWEVVADWQELEQRLAARKWLFTKHAKRSYTQATFEPGDALVFGSESRGLPSRLLDSAPNACLRIPMATEARSLNLSNAVAIALYEAVRQCPNGLA